MSDTNDEDFQFLKKPINASSSPSNLRITTISSYNNNSHENSITTPLTTSSSTHSLHNNNNNDNNLFPSVIYSSSLNNNNNNYHHFSDNNQTTVNNNTSQQQQALLPKKEKEKYNFFGRNKKKAGETSNLKISTLLDDEDVNFQIENLPYATLLNSLKKIRQYKWSLCISTTFSIILIILFIVLLIYHLFFFHTFFYIDQIQINQLPIIDRTVGFRIKIIGYNPNIVNVYLNSIFLNVKIFDAQKSIFYNIERPIDYIFNSTCSYNNNNNIDNKFNNETFVKYKEIVNSFLVKEENGEINDCNRLWDKGVFTIDYKIYIGDLNNFLQLFDLFMRNVYFGIYLEGKISVSLGGISYDIPLQKNQQYVKL
ncbi:hypothetical protein ABK040_009096 [Willaertia magna]